MKLSSSIGINPQFWGVKPLGEFLEKFKGKIPEKKLKEVYKECKKLAKAK